MARHQVQQGPRLERLDQIIGRPLAHGVHGTLDGAMGSHQQHRQLWLAGSQQAKQLMTIHARHVDVADHQAEGLEGHRFQCFLSTADSLVVMTGQQQGIRQGLAQCAVVFNQ